MNPIDRAAVDNTAVDNTAVDNTAVDNTAEPAELATAIGISAVVLAPSAIGAVRGLVDGSPGGRRASVVRYGRKSWLPSSSPVVNDHDIEPGTPFLS